MILTAAPYEEFQESGDGKRRAVAKRNCRHVFLLVLMEGKERELELPPWGKERRWGTHLMEERR